MFIIKHASTQLIVVIDKETMVSYWLEGEIWNGG